MPTAYTARIKNDVSFKEFAMCCARGMGACVTLRNSSLDTPIPEEFSVDPYHSEEESKLLYHREIMAEEFRAVHERTQWLKELRDSLDNYEGM